MTMNDNIFTRQVVRSAITLSKYVGIITYFQLRDAAREYLDVTNIQFNELFSKNVLNKFIKLEGNMNEKDAKIHLI